MLYYSLCRTEALQLNGRHYACKIDARTVVITQFEFTLNSRYILYQLFLQLTLIPFSITEGVDTDQLHDALHYIFLLFVPPYGVVRGFNSILMVWW